MENVLEIVDLKKKFRGFELNVKELNIPKGFATALIGENGAGKSTLLNILAGIRVDYKGHIRYFGKYEDGDRDKEEYRVRENIGYTGPGGVFLPHWTAKEVAEVSEILFEGFHRDRFEQLCSDLAISEKNDKSKKFSALSDGNRMKMVLAAAFARDTSLLIMDEPASPLDPLMRDKLCSMIREYLAEEEGERSVLFSTHNISDMENVTDYAIIMEHGKIVEQGFVEDLKEKYILVKGNAEDAALERKVLYSITENKYGFEGICLACRLDELAGLNVEAETPTLFQISVAIMKQNTVIR